MWDTLHEWGKICIQTIFSLENQLVLLGGLLDRPTREDNIKMKTWDVEDENGWRRL
jgi:hypothetical protein